MKRTVKRYVQRRLEDSVRRLLENHHPVIVAVTGSYGKTGTKEAIVAVLRNKYQVITSQPGYNSELSLPLSIFGLRTPAKLWNLYSWWQIFRSIERRIENYPYDALVIEMGADQPGDIGAYLTYIKPDIAVITAVGPTHLELFGSVDKVFAEKWRLAEDAKHVIYNADDKRLLEAASKLGPRKATGYGLGKGEVRAATAATAPSGTLNVLLTVGGKRFPLETQVIAPHSLYALLAAAAVGLKLKITPAKIVKELSRIAPERGRMRPLSGRKGSLIIDDSYNANPDAVLAALSTLKSLNRRKIAVLGNMNELGGYTKEAHRRVGVAAARSSDILITIGSEAKDYLAAEALKRGKDPQMVKSFTDPYNAGEYLSEVLQRGDAVLVKGSQNGVFAEEAIKPILQRPQSAARVLVRQSPEWLRKKRRSFGKS